MNFLNWIFGTIFLALVGLYIHLYDQYHQFVYKIAGDRLYIIDRKNHRVIEKEAHTFKLLLRGNEDFFANIFIEPQTEEESPLPKPAPARSGFENVEIIEPEMSPAEVATDVFESTIFQDPPIPKSSFCTDDTTHSASYVQHNDSLESKSPNVLKSSVAQDLAQDVAKNAVSAIVSHEIGEHLKSNHRQREDY